MPDPQGWIQIGELGLALVLSTMVGLERELRQKSAGLRTHTLVGLGACLMMLVSKFGFFDIASIGGVFRVDPSRVAAQIVTGIGFIGGGLIFVRRDAVRGLTTAAAVWLTAGIGMACGSGLYILAIAATAGHYFVSYAYLPLQRRLPRSTVAPSEIHITYRDGAGILRNILVEATNRHFTVAEVAIDRLPEKAERSGEKLVAVSLVVQGSGQISELVAAFESYDGVLQVSAGDVNETSD